MKKLIILSLLLIIGLFFSFKLYKTHEKFKKIKALDVLSDQNIPSLRIKLLYSYPHDHLAFTQGLQWHEGIMYESTGLKNKSSLRKIDISSGKVLMKLDVPYPYFAEGITIFKDRIYQLTWKSEKCFVYEKNTFEKVHEFSYTGQGWGLTNDSNHLIMSDGTEKLFFLDPETFTIIRIIEVHINNKKINNINELEYINGEIFANIYRTNTIARINPLNGNITGIINLTPLYEKINPFSFIDVPNGIAYNPETKEIYLTGKCWPRIFKIKIED